MRWTKEQERAITLRNKNILVAAAAGSGKTAVLVERIKRLILEDGCGIDNMLIVTFTNAAAAEMKEKIEKAIHKEIAENPKAAPRLKGQLDLIPLANISTFHAFALEVIRRYFYIIDIDPNFKICDNIQQELLKEQALDELTKRYYDEAAPEFFAFLDKYSGDRNDARFRQTVRKTFEVIQSLPEPYPWLKEAVEELDADYDEFANGKVIGYILRDTKERINTAAYELKKATEAAQHTEHEGICEIAAIYMNLAAELAEKAECGDFDKLREALDGVKMPSLLKKYFKPDESHTQAELDEFKELLERAREPLKEAVAALKKDYYYDSLENLHAQTRASYADGKFFLKVMEDYRDIFTELKSAKRVVDFNDIEHFAFEILKDEEAAEYYRRKFSYIFIDEYQDSNILQEALIAKIKRENNLFMVGDVKQSIYKFRLAEPEIFQGKYRAYKLEEEQAASSGRESISEKIDLNKNFRSKKSIIDLINKVFYKIMPGYDENAALYLGDPFGEQCNFTPKMFLAETPWDADSEIDDELKNMIKAEKEALSAVKIIKDSLGKTIFDSPRGIERPLQKRDIVILMRGTKSYGDIFYKILTDNNLPTYVDDNDGYFDTMEINIFMSLLALLDNEKQDIQLLTVMRSEIFGFTIRELTEIRIASYDSTGSTDENNDSAVDKTVRTQRKACSYREAVIRYSNYGCDEKLRIKCKEALDKLSEWRKLARVLPIEELVWQLMLDTGFYVAMGAMPAGSQRQANLRALADKALSYRKNQGGSLYGFMQYIEAVKQHKVAMGQIKIAAEGEDTIRIMTIHKSKGLEFPMVLLAGFCRRLNYTKSSKDISIHKDLGIGFPLVNYNESWIKTGIIQNAVRAKLHQEEVDEEKRILYVAMTRAKDILYILGIVNEREETIKNLLQASAKDGSYFAMSGKIIYNDSEAREFIQNEDLQNISKGARRNAQKALELLEPTGESSASKPENTEALSPLEVEIDRRMKFEYPYARDLEIKSKYAVSELNEMNLHVGQESMHGDEKTDCERAGYVFSTAADSKTGGSYDIELSEPKSFKLRSDFTSAQLGTITHKVLEKLDFQAALGIGKYAEAGCKYIDTAAQSVGERKAVEGYVSELFEYLVNEEFLTRDEIAAVDGEKLIDFVLSPLGRRMARAQCENKLMREKPFNLMCEVDGVQSMIQGIIDCFFEEDGELVLVDYKTTQVRDGSSLAARRPQIRQRYQTQIDLYRRALTASTGKSVKEAYLYLTNIGEAIEL